MVVGSQGEIERLGSRLEPQERDQAQEPTALWAVFEVRQEPFGVGAEEVGAAEPGGVPGAEEQGERCREGAVPLELERQVEATLHVGQERGEARGVDGAFGDAGEPGERQELVDVRIEAIDER